MGENGDVAKATKPAKRGRPAQGDEKLEAVINLRVSAELLEAMQARAAKDDLTLAMVLRAMGQEYAAGRFPVRLTIGPYKKK